MYLKYVIIVETMKTENNKQDQIIWCRAGCDDCEPNVLIGGLRYTTFIGPLLSTMRREMKKGGVGGSKIEEDTESLTGEFAYLWLKETYWW